ncbi:helix-turn-helix transcriptional regulator [uncultured Pseudoalteromonas sp.]|uniref:helix-turn-helix domain-containing protein n=1 Tax=uncultured Pseudoalteromonas sp. TaxID=114053 RepID=UPI0025FA43E8|nr:helix-turn-helix transcriptional regulator [uncultured Pseudoalteromonas sp.]
MIRWLVDARRNQGLTVRQFAALIDESHQFVNKVETFQRKLNVYEYVQYCQALGLEPTEGLSFLKK